MKNRTILDSFRNAWRGVRHTAAKERNFKIHIFCAIAAVAACIVFSVEISQFLLVAFAIFSVLCAELFNTAIEAVIDLLTGGKKHPLAKIAKDAAAGAVLLAAVQALIIAAAVAYRVLQVRG